MVQVVKELWTQALLPYNLPFTVLLGLVVVFWVLTLLGAIGSDSIEPDLDADGGEFSGDIGDLPAAMLRLVNAGSVPVTIVLSILVLAMWIAAILLNYYLNPGESVLLALGYVVVGFILALVATKVITQPLVPFMRRLKDAENAAPVIGEIGVVRSMDIDSKFGQVEVHRPDGAPAILSARLGPESEPALRGTQVAILSLDPVSGLYLVRPISASPSIE